MYLLTVKQDKSEIIEISVLICVRKQMKNGTVFRENVFVKLDITGIKIKIVLLTNVHLALRETGMEHVLIYVKELMKSGIQQKIVVNVKKIM